MLGMWHLKFRYRHTDCIVVPLLEKHSLTIQLFHIGRYTKGDYIYVTFIQILNGALEGISKYARDLQKNKKILRLERLNENTFMTLAKHKREIELYGSAYDPQFISATPSYWDEKGFEVHELISWEKKPLQEHIRILKRNKTTEYFELLSFTEKKLDNIYTMNLFPKLAPKQEKAIKLAFTKGYYEFPRRISLDKLAKLVGVAKPTFRENLRKAEAKLIPKMISE